MTGGSPFSALLLAAAVFGSIGGCRDLTAPVPVGTRFALVTIGGATLPTTTGSIPSGWTELADTIVFLGEVGAASGTVEHHETGRLPNMSPTTTVYQRSYRWDGHVLRFSPPPCPPNALCARAIQEMGILMGGHLTITYDDPSVLRRNYRRIS